METYRYKVGDAVRSLVDAQGLRKGSEYVVVGVTAERFVFGHFVTYELEPADEPGRRLHVRNGHLVLRALGDADDAEATERAGWLARRMQLESGGDDNGS